jgi:DNA-binding NtrC family response regulator
MIAIVSIKKPRGPFMTEAFESGDVTFLEFSSGDSAATRTAKIATFAAPMGCGRTRPARSTDADDRCALIGKSPEMQDVKAHLRRIAPSAAPVMFVGESGTGKEVAAQLLHQHSSRADAPFVSVNCGAIPANLVEAELFGYERGAFTGAMRQHQGYFERAAGGTLFLDEITEMPIELQGKLLRVLETGRMIRIGGTEEIAVDVRIVTATNRPSETIVRDRRMREDLFYRLAVFIVRLPPLRSRRDDIELLARAFLARLNEEYGTSKWFDSSTLEVARHHAWPGNVRELKNCVERSFVLCDDVVALDLQPAPEGEIGEEHSADCVRLPIGVTMADAERELLLATLKHCGGNKRRTADVLGVSLKTVYNKLVGYGATPLLRAAGQC